MLAGLGGAAGAPPRADAPPPVNSRNWTLGPTASVGALRHDVLCERGEQPIDVEVFHAEAIMRDAWRCTRGDGGDCKELRAGANAQDGGRFLAGHDRQAE